MGDYLMNMAMQEITSAAAEALSQMMGVVVLASLPLLVFAVAYCFFGMRIFRILLVINGALIGGIFGALLLGISMQSGGGAVVGFLLFAGIFGALSWFLYKVFLFIQTFVTGFVGVTGILLLISKNIPLSMIMGLIAGMALGVLICIYTKLFIMLTTAYKGAGTIAAVISLFFLTSGAYVWIYALLVIAFTVAGFYVQNMMYNKNPIDIMGTEGSSKNTKESRNKPAKAAGSRLVGIDGMYKGFEFDIEDSLALGRDAESCNVIFPDSCAGVSRIQCQMFYDKKAKETSIVDKFSSYGTTLNGSRMEINRVYPLKDGDVIMFGENNVFKVNC